MVVSKAVLKSFKFPIRETRKKYNNKKKKTNYLLLVRCSSLNANLNKTAVQKSRESQKKKNNNNNNNNKMKSQGSGLLAKAEYLDHSAT